MPVIKIILDELNAYLKWIVFSLPGKSGAFFRLIYAKLLFSRCERGVRIGQYMHVRGGKNIILGENVRFDIQCSMDARGGSIAIGDRTGFNQNVNINATIAGSITIGNDCLIGPNVLLRSANHNFESHSINMNQQGHTGSHIVIGNNVWIGANAAILPGAAIGDGCIVAAGAVVNKSFPENTILGGVPAKIIKERKL